MRTLILTTCIILTVAMFPMNVYAATVNISAADATCSIGARSILKVYVSSPETAINAVSGTITFPTDRLSVISVTKAGSILTMWVQEPSVSGGTITFAGVVVNPGFIGQRGPLFTITVQTKKLGVATLAFTGAEVLANDGEGSNVLTGTSGATLAVCAPTPSATKMPSPSPRVLPEVRIVADYTPIIRSAVFVIALLVLWCVWRLIRCARRMKKRTHRS